MRPYLLAALGSLLFSSLAHSGDWLLYTKETPKAPWKKDRQEMRDIEPWPFAIAPACNVTLAGGNHEVKVSNKVTKEERTALCDDVNAALAQHQRDEAASRKRPAAPDQGKVKLW